MKAKLSLFILSVGFIAALNVNFSHNDKLNPTSILLKKNIEALAQEGNSAVYTRYYTMDVKTVYYNNITPGTYGFASSGSGWKESRCCISATYMDGCDFSSQTDDC